jgi:AcrR family transcriptional regulator
LTLRERKSIATATSLTRVSRRLTISRGLAGFTIDEVCSEVGISRRTFFNYFPSKDDAVIGADSEEESRRIAAEFLERGASGWSAVVDDLVGLVVKHFDSAGVDAADHTEFLGALEAEPKLLARFIGISRERERMLIGLVAAREGAHPDDPRAGAVVNILSTVIRMAAERFIEPGNSLDFSFLLTSTLADFRAVLTIPAPRKAHS